MERLTGDNTNAEAHRIAGDTLIVNCPGCEHGEIVMTDMIEDRNGQCLGCSSRYQLFISPISN